MPDNAAIDAVFSEIERCLEFDNPDTTMQAVLRLSQFRNERNRFPDELIDRLLNLLRTERVLSASAAAPILVFFEFEASRLTRLQKQRCLTLLQEKLDQFKDGDALHIAREIVEGNYLK